jgi:hypothetical protein
VPAPAVGKVPPVPSRTDSKSSTLLSPVVCKSPPVTCVVLLGAVLGNLFVRSGSLMAALNCCVAPRIACGFLDSSACNSDTARPAMTVSLLFASCPKDVIACPYWPFWTAIRADAPLAASPRVNPVSPIDVPRTSCPRLLPATVESSPDQLPLLIAFAAFAPVAMFWNVEVGMPARLPVLTTAPEIGSIAVAAPDNPPRPPAADAIAPR